jgi:SNF2 family DNA or RNA helicase
VFFTVTIHPTPFQKTKFFRIVLDEAHTIKNATSKISKNLNQIQARKKILASGKLPAVPYKFV